MYPPKLRLIQCGAGGMGKTWWDGPVRDSPEFELVAMVDVVDEPLNEAAQKLGLARDQLFKSLDAAVEAVEADAVLTVTPPPVHFDHAKLAFSRGLHLLTEKPIAHDLESAKSMVQMARKANRQLMVAQNYRYSAPIQKLKSLFAEKPVGEFGHGHIDFYIPADFTGTFRETMEFPLLVDMAIHHVDLIRAVTGRNIVSVSAQTFKPAWSWYQHHPGLKMLMQLEGDLPFSYSGDWSAKGKSTTWNGTWRLQCAEGSIHLENDEITIGRCEKWNKNPTTETVEVPNIPLKQQHALLHNFVESIRASRPAETSAEDNLWSFAAVMAGVMSTKDGGTSIDVADLVSTPRGLGKTLRRKSR